MKQFTSKSIKSCGGIYMPYNTTGLGRVPAAFISSTCYDLKQVRTDLKDFFNNQVGLEPILSEQSSFPTTPGSNTIDTCIRAVQERADIFILIVGKRYGYITDQNKSITNLEYLHARSKGIPIYIFVEKLIKANLPIWKANPKADFSPIVDSPKLFEFVETLYSQNGGWVYEFEIVQEIITTLKIQLAYLFNDSLLLRKQYQGTSFSPKLLKYSGEIFRTAIEKPNAWEYILFAKTLKENLQNLIDLKYDLKYGISLKSIIQFEEPVDILNWIGRKTSEIILLVSFLKPIVLKAYQEATGEPGESGDVDYIIYVAEKLVGIYERIISWGLDFKNVIVPDEYTYLLSITSKLNEVVIEDIENFADKYEKGLQEILTGITENSQAVFTLQLREPDTSLIYDEIESLRRKFLAN